METTLGKRIMLCRKKLGLTQDKLAEHLGVTPQAVSKWENDQSCPDIMMLPKLSSLFGITTDELLGIEREAKDELPILEGTVEDGNTKKGPHNFELNFEPGKRDAIFIAVFVLFMGALSLVSALVGLEISFWNILWPSAILAAGIRGFFRKFSYFSIVCFLLGSYFLLENIGYDLNVSWKLAFPILILLLGLSLFVDALRKPKHSRWYMRHNNKVVSHKGHGGNLVNDYSESEDTGTFSCSLSFGSDYRQVTMERMVSGNIDCSFGELTLDLCSCESFAENCRLDVDRSFGSTTILVPKLIQVIPSSSTAFAGLDIQGSPNADASSVIHMDADVSFGSITVCYC